MLRAAPGWPSAAGGVWSAELSAVDAVKLGGLTLALTAVDEVAAAAARAADFSLDAVCFCRLRV